MLRSLLIIVLTTTLLSGCKTVPSNKICPPLQVYSKVWLAETSKEVEAIANTSPHVMKMLKDYGITRDQIRACLK